MKKKLFDFKGDMFFNKSLNKNNFVFYYGILRVMLLRFVIFM